MWRWGERFLFQRNVAMIKWIELMAKMKRNRQVWGRDRENLSRFVTVSKKLHDSIDIEFREIFAKFFQCHNCKRRGHLFVKYYIASYMYICTKLFSSLTNSVLNCLPNIHVAMKRAKKEKKRSNSLIAFILVTLLHLS